MDPIDKIALRFGAYCQDSLTLFAAILDYMNGCKTVKEAFDELTRFELIMFVDTEHPERIARKVEKLRRCIAHMDEIVTLAKKVFILNFYESDPDVVFRKEVSFSYACKMLSQYGPLLVHFSGAPTNLDVVQAELTLAWMTPTAALCGESDLLCLEAMEPIVLN
jgi:hypothetical protein